jgi:hypothetical protein
VGVNFTVQDDGVLPGNLRREELTVLEDGRVIPDVVLFSQSSDMPLQVALLIDRSDSMSKGFAKLRRGAQRYLSRGRRDLSISIFFCHQPKAIASCKPPGNVHRSGAGQGNGCWGSIRSEPVP